MGVTLRGVLLLCSLTICTRVQARTLAVYVQNAGELSPASTSMTQSELQRLLAPVSLEVKWKDFVDRKLGEDFDFTVVGSIEGSCSTVEPGKVVKAPAHPVIGLADTSVSAGEVLPFFRVDCPRLVRMLESEMETPLLGRALARVVAHELYHILAKTTQHRDSGIAKAAFSVHDLVTPELDFDKAGLAQIKSPLMIDVVRVLPHEKRGAVSN